MPFCETCTQFHQADSLDEEGHCPGCGQVIVQPRKVPWHFKLMVVATAVYLLYRIGQGIDWLVRHVHL